MAGVQPLALTEDPYVGYSNSQPLFVEETEPDGQIFMVTNPVKLTHFNAQKFPRKKAPGTYRIFSVGGSTAYGHPWRDPVSFSGWLRELLPAADNRHPWEVINAGGISYASYREAVLIAELIQYQPDLFLVYSGHNEFLEERTYRKTVGIPAFIRNLSARLDHTRTYSALKRLIRSVQSQKNPSSSSQEKSAVKTNGYRLEGEVNDILANTIGPTSYRRDDTLRQNILEHYQISLGRMAELAHSVGAEVIFMTTPGNEKDCSPFKSEATPGLTPEMQNKVTAWLSQAHALALADRPDQALMYFDSALSLDGRNASIAYAAGQAAWSSHQNQEAKQHFRRALDEDICPLRALPAMRDIVLKVAREHAAQAVDITRILEEKTVRDSGNDILGEPNFVDHVHLSIENYQLIALSILDKLAALGVVKKAPDFGDTQVKTVTNKVLATMGSHERGEGLHNLAKVINWAGKHEDAARIAERALTVDSEGLEAIWSSLFVGAARERHGQGQEALLHYRRAIRLDSNNLLSHQYLAAALLRLDSNQAAEIEFMKILQIDPTDMEANAKLASLRKHHGQSEEARSLLELGKRAQLQGNVPDAINFYSRALTIDPQLEEARLGLSQALGGLGVHP